ncbi:OLC1v1023726C1 [Oldenlandia corymbosa var. corymbosa]|uniref:OLC1v1023726C1 n=1 Tax=Oldenlandia corymbosa var. corymbosa TaxID=529605 RepID=A0AAV1C0M9_OLDCO|nr:OLC1v1023726C1 [Oldenlandia corymbosa var. corymbosa]
MLELWIFSLYQKDIAIDPRVPGLLENIKEIRTVVEEQAVEKAKFNFPKTNLSGFLDFLLENLLQVRNCMDDSDIQSCIQIIGEHLVFLRSFVGILEQLQQEDLQALHNLAVEVAYKMEFLIDQLVLGDSQNSFSASFVSIKEDIGIIKTDAMKIFCCRRQPFQFQKLTRTPPFQVAPQRSATAADEVVGMPSLGKTTLCTTFMFVHDSISQVFNMKEVVLALLAQMPEKLPNGYIEMTEGDLVQELWRSLKQRRNCTRMEELLKFWAKMKIKASRIVLTSRQYDAAPEALLDEKPHFLRPLTGNESFQLFRCKLFPGKDWPASLYEVGKQLVEICRGLPLTIVVMAGILLTRNQDAWNEVLENLEDRDVSVKRLIWYWIAEGFVRKSKSTSLEEVAVDYLKNLIGRSLVIEANKTSRGHVKACWTHDLIHDFCLRKAKEDNFFELLKSSEELLCFNEPGNLRRLCIHAEPEQFLESKLFCPRLRSLMFFDPNPWTSGPVAIFGNEKSYKCQPIHSNLHNLETLILRPLSGFVALRETFWNLHKLRHVCISNYGSPSFGIELPVDNLDSSSNLYELDSLSNLGSQNWDNMEKRLRKFPNIRRLKCSLRTNEDDPDNGTDSFEYFGGDGEDYNILFATEEEFSEKDDAVACVKGMGMTNGMIINVVSSKRKNAVLMRCCKRGKVSVDDGEYYLTSDSKTQITGCKFKLYVHLVDGKWHIRVYPGEFGIHNHELFDEDHPTRGFSDGVK